MTTPSERLKAAREAAGYDSAAAFARAMDETEATYRSYENGTRALTVAAAKRIAGKLGNISWQRLMLGDEASVETAAELEAEDRRKHPPASPSPSRPENIRRMGRNAPMDSIAEIDVYGGMGGGGEALVGWQPDGNGGRTDADAVKALWELPPDYLRNELHVGGHAARIIQVKGDSMEPLLMSGDRVMVNLADRSPSPPGVFALWDGLGVVVKRVELIMGSDPPCLLISSDNPKHRAYERTIDEVQIIGRVIWFARRL